MAGPERFTSGDQGLRRSADGHQCFAYPDAFSSSLSHFSMEKSARAAASKNLVNQGVLSDLVLVASNPSDKNTERKVETTGKEKPTPKDGQTLTLKQLLEDFKTPFIDAYERSKCLKDGQPGKSKTLEQVVGRLKAIPWSNDIRITFNSTAKNPEYREHSSRITINPTHSTYKQIEEFAHEAYHATHQFLSKVYGGGRLDRQSYIDTYVRGEVDALLTETAVHRELNLPGAITYSYYDQRGNIQNLDVSDCLRTNGAKSLFDVLYYAQPTNWHEKPYGVHYGENDNNYAKNFDDDKKAANALIRTWVRTGHQRDDI